MLQWRSILWLSFPTLGNIGPRITVEREPADEPQQIVPVESVVFMRLIFTPGVPSEVGLERAADDASRSSVEQLAAEVIEASPRALEVVEHRIIELVGGILVPRLRGLADAVG